MDEEMRKIQYLLNLQEEINILIGKNFSSIFHDDRELVNKLEEASAIAKKKAQAAIIDAGGF